MSPWQIEFSRALRHLRRHAPLPAIRHMQHALRYATDLDAGRRTKAMLQYYLAMSLRKAGMRNRAVGAWVESARLSRRTPAWKKLQRNTNTYGMARQDSCELDHHHAFYGVQLERYLRSKKSQRLGTRAEVDMVIELVDEHWREIREQYDLDAMTTDERLELYRDVVIVFPFLSVPEAFAGKDLPVDFNRGRIARAGDRCPCGSGLPFGMCHGRPPGIDEVLTGIF